MKAIIDNLQILQKLQIWRHSKSIYIIGVTSILAVDDSAHLLPVVIHVCSVWRASPILRMTSVVSVFVNIMSTILRHICLTIWHPLYTLPPLLLVSITVTCLLSGASSHIRQARGPSPGAGWQPGNYYQLSFIITYYNNAVVAGAAGLCGGRQPQSPRLLDRGDLQDCLVRY